MKLSKYVKLVKGGGYCMVAHVEDSGIWLGTGSAIFRATERRTWWEKNRCARFWICRKRHGRKFILTSAGRAQLKASSG